MRIIRTICHQCQKADNKPTSGKTLTCKHVLLRVTAAFDRERFQIGELVYVKDSSAKGLCAKGVCVYSDGRSMPPSVPRRDTRLL